jgi:hypothetical protein
MPKYIAKVSFLDADGTMIEAGLTRVSHEADAYKQHPERFELLRSSTATADAITRPCSLLATRRRGP